MRQTTPLLKTLKQELKACGITYRAVADHLGLSEASVKRLFSSGSFSLDRFEQVCELAQMSFHDLVLKTARNQNILESLSLEQEKEIASDLVLLLVAVSVMNGMTFIELVEHYSFSETECIQKLAQLDRLKFLQLLPGNRIKLLISADFRWRSGGPIQQFFLEKVEQDFFSSTFQRGSEKLLVLNGICTQDTNAKLQALMEKFSREFSEVMKSEPERDMQKKKGNTLVLALREWEFGLFADLQR